MPGVRESRIIALPLQCIIGMFRITSVCKKIFFKSQVLGGGYRGGSGMTWNNPYGSCSHETF